MPGRRRPSRSRSRLTRPILLAATFAVTFLAGFAYASWSLVCRGSACPDPRQLDAFQPHQTSKLYADDGRFVAELGLERRTLVPLSEIPKTVQEAFVITEDKRFYQHHGIDWIRVAGAAVHNLGAGAYAQGFSTLTMQLARNRTALSQEQDPRALPQSDLPRQRRVWRRDRGAALLRKIGARSQSRRS